MCAHVGFSAEVGAVERCPERRDLRDRRADIACVTSRDLPIERGQSDSGGAPADGGVTLSPDKVEKILEGTATDHACPAQEPFTYAWSPAPAPEDYTATCEGSPKRNGFYGNGIVDALAAIGSRGH